MSRVAPWRALARWSWRLFRREWQQRVLVMTLLAVAVTASVVLSVLAFNIDPPATAEFGRADRRIRFGGDAPTATTADVAAARRAFGTVDVVTTTSASLPGSVQQLDLRAADPYGPYVGPMTALRSGRYPHGAGEMAVTDGALDELGARVDDVVVLDGARRRIVGIVENTGDLDDEYALVPPGSLAHPTLVTLLVRASVARVEQFRSQMTYRGNVERDGRGDNAVVNATSTLMLAAVGMVLVALIAAAAFVVLAQRRLRQFGLLAAMGATEREVRVVTIADGLAVGIVAAAIGGAGGIGAWVALRPFVEHAAAHRIHGLSAPWWLIASSLALAIVTATGAAWWPARVVARVPIVAALARRPPPPPAAHRSTLLSLGLTAVGVTCLSLAHGDSVVLVLAGIVCTPAGVLLLAPVVVRTTARLAGRLRLPGRIALRDLGRYQARAGAALAAISMALGLPLAAVVFAAAAQHGAGEGSLAAGDVLVRAGDAPEPFVIPRYDAAAQRALDARARDLAARVGATRVVPLDMAVVPGMRLEPGLGDTGAVPALQLARQRRGSDRIDALTAYVGTPSLLDALNVPRDVFERYDVVTSERGSLSLIGDRSRRALDRVGAMSDPGYTSLPDAVLSPSFVKAQGWHEQRAGWWISSPHPLTGAQRSLVHKVAAAAGVRAEVRDRQAALRTRRLQATAFGTVLALGILAMTIGLLRAESAGDVRTLTASGAPPRTLRSITAATAAALATLGVALGVVGAYVVLVAAYFDDRAKFLPVPVANVAVIVFGVPLLAYAAGWLLAGRRVDRLTVGTFD